MSRLENRRALVTGAASGIGRAIARAYGAEGAKVAMLDVDADALNEAAAETDGRTLQIECDVRDPSAVNEAVQHVVDEWDGLDIVMNNAGIINRKALVDIPDEELERVVDINLNGALRVARATIPALTESEGTLINMSSVVSVEGTERRSVYATTKGGLKTLTHHLAVELAPTVRVNALAPGTVETPLSDDVRQNEEYTERLERTPLERFASPDEIAAPAVFLASEEASYMTGHVLFVDGGRSVS